jgi:hypothetical protein
MAVPVLIEKLEFNLITGELVIKDQTDWAAAGLLVGTDTITINLKVELINDSVTTLYDNLAGASPDIVPATSLFNITAIQIPLDSDGKVIWGTYRITATAHVVKTTDPTDDYYVNGIFDYAYAFTLPTMCLTHQVNCLSATVTGRDETEYLTDESNIVRENNLYPPPALAPVQGGTQQVFIYNGGTYQMWTGTWTHEVSSGVTYTLPSGATLVVLLEATVEFQVDCDTTMCKIRCCIEKVGKRFNNAKITNPKAANDILNLQIIPIGWALQQWTMARECGNVDDMALYLAEIKEISGCKGNCKGCKGDEPQLIIPLTSGGANSVIVDSPNGTVTVTPQTVGTTQYFHLEVAQWIINIINNLNPVAVATDTPAWLTVTPSIILGVKTYTITFNAAALEKENHIEIRGKINKNPDTTAGQPYFIFTPEYIYTNGAEVNPSSSYSFVLGTTTPNISTDEMVLSMSNFKNSTDNLSYTVHCQLMRKHPNRATSLLLLKDMELEACWFDTASDYFTLRFYNPITGVTKRFTDVVPLDTELYFSLSVYIKPTL